MKTAHYFIIALIVLLNFGCTNTDKKQLRDFAAFKGTWQLENSNTFETWETCDNFIAGKVIKIENGDTLFVENLRILSDKNAIYYEATVPLQNKGKAVRFKLTEQNNNKFVFENPEHDFPQKISYTFLNKKEMKAIISGGNKQISLNYKKTK